MAGSQSMDKRNRWRSNAKVLVVLLFSFIVAGCTNKCCPEIFLGPIPGVTYHYKSPDGIEVIAKGLSEDETHAVHVEETTYFPPDMRLNGLPPTSTRTYILYTHGCKVLLSFQGRISTLVDTSASHWEMPLVHNSGEISSEHCEIMGRHEEYLFGETREVVEVSCAMNQTTNMEYALASGIGMVRFFDFELVDIIRQGFVKW